MWLLTTDRAELRWFPRPPDKYAILSHVWETDSEEQSFQDLQGIIRSCEETGENPRSLVSEKIMKCCVWAESHGIKLVWIDFCCIDKTSSAELSEAINSMFAWYAGATVCYAYLRDVSDEEPPSAPDSAFRRSRWFTRGWTLQELIAPKAVIFLSNTWVPIASKRSMSLLLEEITGVDAAVLMGTISVHEVSVARRMSWASARQTSRVEDEAYCLMGIFGVHFPTIYGEGKEAFIRLQEEIMRRTPDTTLLAWGPRGDPVETILGYRSVFPTHQGTSYIENSCLLAPSPAAFAECSDLISVSKKVFSAAYNVQPHTVRFTVTSHGIQANCPVIDFSNGCMLLLLPCCRAADQSASFVALVLRFQHENNPWCVSTRTLFEELTLVRAGDGDGRTLSMLERLLAKRTVVQKLSYHREVRCLLLPVGFDFEGCMQRPLNRSQLQVPRPRWERNYIACRPQHVICINPSSDGALSSRLRPSRSPYYHLFFPSWVISRLRFSGFTVPCLEENPSRGLNAGEQLSISFFDWRRTEQLRMEIRADAYRRSPGNPSVAALWCTILLPSDTNRSLDAGISALRGEWGSWTRRSSTSLDESLIGGSRSSDEESADGTATGSVLDSGLTPSEHDVTDDGDIEVEAGYVDLWQHSGCRGCKEFFSGRWRLLLTFTRLVDSAVLQQGHDIANVYLVDIQI
ncbi:HET-domain-containing protein, partial [Pilatotrama ljubarskyi]